jgi:hypothetical protein
LVFTFAKHPEHDRDEQDQYGDHEQVSYALPHIVSLVTGFTEGHSTPAERRSLNEAMAGAGFGIAGLMMYNVIVCSSLVFKGL